MPKSGATRCTVDSRAERLLAAQDRGERIGQSLRLARLADHGHSLAQPPAMDPGEPGPSDVVIRNRIRRIAQLLARRARCLRLLRREASHLPRFAPTCRAQAPRAAPRRHRGPGCYRTRIRVGPTTVNRSRRSNSRRPRSRSRMNARTTLRPDLAGRNKTTPAWLSIGYCLRLATPLSSVKRIRFSAATTFISTGSFAPESCSSKTVSASWPNSRRSATSSPGRFSSILNFTMP